MSSLYDRFYAQAQSGNPYADRIAAANAAMTPLPDGLVGGSEARDAHNQRRRESRETVDPLVKKQSQYYGDRISDMATDHYADLRTQLASRVTGMQEDRRAAQKAAADAYRADATTRMEAASRAQQNTGSAATLSGSLAPLQSITGVSLNSDLAGGNIATDAFYVAPDATGSKTNVASPIGGGLGTRTKSSTADITSDPDTFGSKKKEQF